MQKDRVQFIPPLFTGTAGAGLSSFIFCLFSISSLFAAERADFLILGNVGSLEILNRYEQPISPKEKKGFLENSPLQIIEEETELGDGVTIAMEVRFEGRAFYLVKGEDQRDIMESRRYRRAQVLDGDEVLAAKDIRTTRGLRSGRNPGTITKGTPVTRVFTHNNLSYVKVSKGTPEYAWCSARSSWTREEASRQMSEQKTGPAQHTALKDRLERANETYKQYITAFNKLTGGDRESPRWECDYPESGMACTLVGSMRSGELESSMAVLVREMQNSLLGKPFRVVVIDGGIKVEPLDEEEVP